VATSTTYALDQALLTFVLERHPAPVHADELSRAFAADDWRASVTALLDDGLLHREGGLHVASRAAVRAAVLLG
jgi:hypothetical protein